MLQSDLNTKCQSGFLSVDFCISQPPSTTHEIYALFDINLRETFLEISKAYDKFY